MNKLSKNDHLSRRQFVALTGGTIGLAALGGLSLMAAFNENERKVAPNDFSYKKMKQMY
jgi:hypothetical protein